MVPLLLCAEQCYLLGMALYRIEIPTDGLTEPEMDAVDYLRLTMRGGDEKAHLARLVHDAVALGSIQVTDVAEQLGAFDPDGIIFDDEDEIYEEIIEENGDADLEALQAEYDGLETLSSAPSDAEEPESDDAEGDAYLPEEPQDDEVETPLDGEGLDSDEPSEEDKTA